MIFLEHFALTDRVRSEAGLATVRLDATTEIVD